jgi:hypothetical protein
MSSDPKPKLAPADKPAGLTPDSIVAPQQPPETPDSKALYELEIKGVELAKSRLENRALEQDIQGRGDWGQRIFWLLVVWLVAVVGIVVLQGFAIHKFHLDNSVVIAFIGTTTVDVLSLGYIVANYLFPKPK